MSSSSSSSSSSTPSRASVLYSLACLLGDLDLVLERLEDGWAAGDYSKLVDMVDDLVELVQALEGEQPDSSESLIDDSAVEEQ